MSSRTIDVQMVLQAIGEPTRFRIVELLLSRPHAVGEVAAALGALQPQTSKHLQALEAAAVIRMHQLGRRRVAALNQETLSQLATYLAELARVAGEDQDGAVLRDYEATISRERARLAAGDDARVLRFERDLHADPDAVWKAWTDPALAARWWAPRHFTVAAFSLEPRAGAPVRVVLREGGNAEYESRGRVEQVAAGTLVFTLAPLDPGGDPLFEARHTLTITGEHQAHLRLEIDVSAVRAEAAPAVAGLRPGWEQLLDALEALLHEEPAPPEE